MKFYDFTQKKIYRDAFYMGRCRCLVLNVSRCVYPFYVLLYTENKKQYLSPSHVLFSKQYLQYGLKSCVPNVLMQLRWKEKLHKRI